MTFPCWTAIYWRRHNSILAKCALIWILKPCLLQSGCGPIVLPSGVSAASGINGSSNNKATPFWHVAYGSAVHIATYITGAYERCDPPIRAIWAHVCMAAVDQCPRTGCTSDSDRIQFVLAGVPTSRAGCGRSSHHTHGRQVRVTRGITGVGSLLFFLAVSA